MQTAGHLNKGIFTLAIPLALLAVLAWLSHFVLVAGEEPLSFALSIDFVLTIPFIYYLLIRKGTTPKLTIIPVVLICLFAGRYLLPQQSQTYLGLFQTWVLPCIELFVLGYVSYKVHRAIKSYRVHKGSSPDFYEVLNRTCHEAFPKRVGAVLATELAVVYYAFINWRRRPLQAHEYSYHQKSGTPALLGILIMVIGVETLAIHLLLAGWSPTMAWVLTVLSIYTGLQFFGFAKSLSQRPAVLKPDCLVLRYGILNETSIPLADIERITLSRAALQQDRLCKTLSPFGALEPHNLIITLKKPNTLRGLYGLSRRYQTLALHIDEPQQLIDAIAARG